MWLDTHCHLDAAEFDADRDEVVARARAVGVTAMVLPAVEAAGFERVAAVAHKYGAAYTLGIHPLCVDRAATGDLGRLRQAAQQAMADPRFVGIGEIGLDYFVEGLDRVLQMEFYLAQLHIARTLELPVLLHVRRSADGLLAGLRRVGRVGGIAHAFNGSAQQAQAFLALGFRLGFGGAASYEGSLRIRQLAAGLPAQALVLETDAPDIPPAWLRFEGRALRNEPAELPRIAAGIAELRRESPEILAAANRRNALAALPRLAASLS